MFKYLILLSLFAFNTFANECRQLELNGFVSPEKSGVMLVINPKTKSEIKMKFNEKVLVKVNPYFERQIKVVAIINQKALQNAEIIKIEKIDYALSDPLFHRNTVKILKKEISCK